MDYKLSKRRLKTLCLGATSPVQKLHHQKVILLQDSSNWITGMFWATTSPNLGNPRQKSTILYRMPFLLTSPNTLSQSSTMRKVQPLLSQIYKDTMQMKKLIHSRLLSEIRAQLSYLKCLQVPLSLMYLLPHSRTKSKIALSQLITSKTSKENADKIYICLFYRNLKEKS